MFLLPNKNRLHFIIQSLRLKKTSLKTFSKTFSTFLLRIPQRLTTFATVPPTIQKKLKNNAKPSSPIQNTTQQQELKFPFIPSPDFSIEFAKNLRDTGSPVQGLRHASHPNSGAV